MKIRLSAHHKSHLDLIGLKKELEELHVPDAEFEEVASAWRRSLPKASDETIFRHAIGTLAFRHHGPHKDKPEDPTPAPKVEEGVKEEGPAPPAVPSRECPQLLGYARKLCNIGVAIALLLLLLLIATVFAPRAHADSKIYVITIKDSSNNPLGSFAAPFAIKCNSNVTCTVGSCPGPTCGILTLDSTASAGSSTFQVNGVSTTSQTLLNFRNNTCTSISNPSAGNIDITFTCQLANTKAVVSHQFLKSYDATTGNFTSGQPVCGDLSDSGTLCTISAALPANNAGSAHNFLTAYNSTTGAFSLARPACADLSDGGTLCSSSAALPANTTATTHNFFTAYNSTTGAYTKAQPACGDLSDAAASCNTDATNAANIGSGTLPAGRMPALTGAVTTSAGSVATSPGKADAFETSLFCSDAGASDTYACNLSPAISAYSTGILYWFKANTANTGAASINFNAVGAITIKKKTSGITTDLADNDIRAGAWVAVIYDGTNMQCVGGCDGNTSAGGGYATVQDEGSSLTQRTTVNFTGAGVTCSDDAGNTRTHCDIPGGSGGTVNSGAGNGVLWLNGAPGFLAGYQLGAPTTAKRGSRMMFTLQAQIEFRYIAVNVSTASGVCGGTCGLQLCVFNVAMNSQLACTSVATSGGAVNINTTGGKALPVASGADVTASVATLPAGAYYLLFVSDSTALQFSITSSSVPGVVINSAGDHRYGWSASADMATGSGGSLAVNADLSSGFTWSDHSIGVPLVALIN